MTLPELSYGLCARLGFRSGMEMTLSFCGKYALLAVRMSKRFHSPQSSADSLRGRAIAVTRHKGRESDYPLQQLSLTKRAMPHSHRIRRSVSSPVAPRSSSHNSCEHSTP